MPTYEDFVRDYWAPDRDAVLAGMQRQQQAQQSVLGAAPPGFEASKWNDPTHQTDKYRAGRYMQQHPNATVDEILGILGGNYSKVSNDKIRDDQGGIIDLWRDYEGAHAPQWGYSYDDGGTVRRMQNEITGDSSNRSNLPSYYNTGIIDSGTSVGNLSSILGLIGGGAGSRNNSSTILRQSSQPAWRSAGQNKRPEGQTVNQMPQMNGMFAQLTKKLRPEGATSSETQYRGALI